MSTYAYIKLGHLGCLLMPILILDVLDVHPLPYLFWMSWMSTHTYINFGHPGCPPTPIFILDVLDVHSNLYEFWMSWMSTHAYLLTLDIQDVHSSLYSFWTSWMSIHTYINFGCPGCPSIYLDVLDICTIQEFTFHYPLYLKANAYRSCHPRAALFRLDA